MTIEAPQGRRRSYLLHPQLRVLPVSILLVVTASLTWLYATPAHGPVIPSDVQIRWWMLAGLAFASEVVVLHVAVRRHAHALSLNELALVLGLFFATPAELVLGWAAGTAAVSLWRRQSPNKAFFNLALCCLDGVVALLTFHLVRGLDPAVDVRAWVAAAAATAVVAAADAVAVGAAIGLVEGDLQMAELGQGFVRGLATTIATTIAALVAVHAVAQNPAAGVLVGCCLVVLLAGYRRFSQLEERHLTLERVHQVSRVLSSTPEVDELLRRVLLQTREVLMADRAEVVFLAAGADQLPIVVRLDPRDLPRQSRLPEGIAHDPLFARLVESGGPVVIPRGSRDPAQRALIETYGARDLVAVPLNGEAGIVGAILASDRHGHLRSFDDDDVRLLLTIADQAGVALQRGELVDRLRHDAQHDALTGLPNRAHLHEQLAEALTAVARGGRGLTLVVVDLRDFRSVNEVLGHTVGDRILHQIGSRLATVARDGDVVARLGGDEFAVILNEVTDTVGALKATQRLLAELEQPIDADGIEVEVGTSLGVAIAPQHGTQPEVLLKRAEAALAAGRRDGNVIQVYDGSLEQPVSPRRLALLSELRHGINTGELVMFLQPQAELATRRVVGAEALVRWAHPLHGLLSPDEFIPLAERSGLIRPLTSWMLAQAIEACGRLARSGQPLCIAVNLSARSVLDPDLVPGIEALLQIHRVEASNLTLEITESSVLGDPRRTREVLDRLHDLGIRLSIDDFGTGYSSLSYLRQLPVQEVKVDRSFVQMMLMHPEDETIVRSIIDLGANLGLEVVAEGVEDQPTWDRLAQMGCSLVQGFHLSRPLPVSDFGPWLARWQARVPQPR